MARMSPSWGECDAEADALPGGQGDRGRYPIQAESGATDSDLRNRDAGAAGVGHSLGKRLITSDGYVAEAETRRIRSQCPWRDSRAGQRDGEGWIGAVRSDGDIAARRLQADCGVKATVNVALWPAVSVIGVVIPLRLYPVPLMPT